MIAVKIWFYFPMITIRMTETKLVCDFWLSKRLLCHYLKYMGIFKQKKHKRELVMKSSAKSCHANNFYKVIN